MIYYSAIVSFKGDKRYIGEHAISQELTNYKNTVAYIKDLFGMNYNDPKMQNKLHYNVTAVPAQENKIGFQVFYYF